MIGQRELAITPERLLEGDNSKLLRRARHLDDILIPRDFLAQPDPMVLRESMKLISARPYRRRRVLATGILVLSLFACRANSSVDAAAQTQERAVPSCDLYEISGPTVIAFFDYASAQADPNFSDTFGDFQFSVQGLRERLDEAVVRVHECQRQSFEIQVHGKRQRFDVEPKGAGYYLVLPGKAARVERGVVTDDDLIEVMRQYFGSQVVDKALGTRK